MEILEQAYTACRARLSAYEVWRDGRQPYPSDSVLTELRVTNDERSAVELYEWLANPPDKYFLYIETAKTEAGHILNGKATTWTGQELGQVAFGRAFYDNFGGERVPVTVFGNNGVHYVGTYFKSAGDYARIRKVARVLCGPRKGQKQ